MNQYKQYLLETYKNQDCYIDPKNRGWASFKIDGDECYINHCYLAPEFRNNHIMEEMCSNIELIAREAGCKYMTGTVDVDSVNPIRSIKMMAHGGYNIHSANNNIIIMIKYLGE